MMTNKIYFFYPSKNVGGAQLLFVRIAKHLSSDYNLKIAVIDYENGFLRTRLQGNDRIEIIHFLPGVKINLASESTIITPLSNITSLDQFFHLDPKENIHFLFWSLQPRNLAAAFLDKGRNLFFRKEKIQPLVAGLSRNKSILFMDNPNYWGARDFLRQDFDFDFLPIPFEIKHEQDVRPPREHNKVNIAWLGRISYEKVSAILDIIEQLANLKNSTEKEVIFHIIGDGDKLPEVKSSAEQNKINYTLTGALLGDQLDNYILNNIDIGFAMGTSCLEFASRKIPSVLLDYSYNKFTEKVKYRWLFETEGYALGQEIQLPNSRSHEFKEILSIAENITDMIEISNKCFDYVMKHHNIKIIGSLLLEKIEKIKQAGSSREIFNAINKYSNPPLYKYLYGPVFNTLLSIKNSFK